ncbi:MAG: hypothetical protein IT382_24510, partial [Deltaproteobacteria bacterium]|nr:hypothetical protein [Deltaproteobacteria bacterium]
MTTTRHPDSPPDSLRAPDRDDVAGPLDLGASLDALRERAQSRLKAQPHPALVEAVLKGERRLAFSLAGQGAAYFDELQELWSGGGAPRAL